MPVIVTKERAAGESLKPKDFGFRCIPRWGAASLRMTNSVLPPPRYHVIKEAVDSRRGPCPLAAYRLADSVPSFTAGLDGLGCGDLGQAGRSDRLRDGRQQ